MKWTWKQFKEHVESHGVEDYTYIEEIHWRASDDPEVKTTTVRID